MKGGGWADGRLCREDIRVHEGQPGGGVASVGGAQGVHGGVWSGLTRDLKGTLLRTVTTRILDTILFQNPLFKDLTLRRYDVEEFDYSLLKECTEELIMSGNVNLMREHMNISMAAMGGDESNKEQGGRG